MDEVFCTAVGLQKAWAGFRLKKQVQVWEILPQRVAARHAFNRLSVWNGLRVDAYQNGMNDCFVRLSGPRQEP